VKRELSEGNKEGEKSSAEVDSVPNSTDERREL
jgi:hypothetical protein